MKHEEYNLQREIVKLLRDHGIIVFSIPNERNQGVSDAVRMRASGLTKGAPDLVCLLNYNRCVFLELKTKTGTRSIEQKAVAAALEGRGFEYRLVRSVDDIQDLL